LVRNKIANESPGPVLHHLDKGEREAIQLAEELEADLIVIDERAGREEALKRNLPVIGTLGILELAAQHDLLDLPIVLAELKIHNFFMSPALEHDLIDRDARRKKQLGS
jgi:predicted nucleic acid-binding protein